MTKWFIHLAIHTHNRLSVRPMDHLESQNQSQTYKPTKKDVKQDENCDCRLLAIRVELLLFSVEAFPNAYAKKFKC